VGIIAFGVTYHWNLYSVCWIYQLAYCECCNFSYKSSPFIYNWLLSPNISIYFIHIVLGNLTEAIFINNNLDFRFFIPRSGLTTILELLAKRILFFWNNIVLDSSKNKNIDLVICIKFGHFPRVPSNIFWWNFSNSNLFWSIWNISFDIKYACKMVQFHIYLDNDSYDFDKSPFMLINGVQKADEKETFGYLLSNNDIFDNIGNDKEECRDIWDLCMLPVQDFSQQIVSSTYWTHKKLDNIFEQASDDSEIFKNEEKKEENGPLIENNRKNKHLVEPQSAPWLIHNSNKNFDEFSEILNSCSSVQSEYKEKTGKQKFERWSREDDRILFQLVQEFEKEGTTSLEYLLSLDGDSDLDKISVLSVIKQKSVWKAGLPKLLSRLHKLNNASTLSVREIKGMR